LRVIERERTCWGPYIRPMPKSAKSKQNPSSPNKRKKEGDNVSSPPKRIKTKGRVVAPSAPSASPEPDSITPRRSTRLSRRDTEDATDEDDVKPAPLPRIEDTVEKEQPSCRDGRNLPQNEASRQRTFKPKPPPLLQVAQPKKHEKEPRRHQLAEILEHPMFKAVIIILIIMDLTCTLLVNVIEKTTLLNPAHGEMWEELAHGAKGWGIRILCIFLLEQFLRVLAFGIKGFFSNTWFVADLVVVSFSLFVEMYLEEYLEMHHGKWVSRAAVGLRLWIVTAFVFDIALGFHEKAEMDEGLEKKKKD